MKWAFIENNEIREILPETNTPEMYGAEFAANCVQVPDEVQQHWVRVGQNFVEPAPAPPAERTLDPWIEAIVKQRVDAYVAQLTPNP